MEILGLDISVLWTDPYGKWLVEGLITTLRLAVIGVIGASIFGVILVVCRKVAIRPLNVFAQSYVYFFRNTPFPVQMLFWYFGFPYLIPVEWRSALYSHDFEFVAASIALVAYTSAYISEHLRSGISAIPVSQMESALSSGFSTIQSLRYVILPQAFRISLPPLISEYLTVAKNSSVAMTIGVAEATSMARRIEAYSFRTFESYGAVSLFYLLLSILTSIALNEYNKRYLKPQQAESTGKRREGRKWVSA